MTIRDFGSRNAVKVDIYNTGFQFILISDEQLPAKPIDKIKCKKGIIKWANSEAVRKVLREVIPPKFKNLLK